MKRTIVVFGVFVVQMATGCQKSEPPNTSGGPAGIRTLVVYSSADKEFAELIFRAYEQKTGVKVLPLYDTEETKTAGLTSRLVVERDHPKADVFW
jgi:iron(III) transport system substrate-binding protein